MKRKLLYFLLYIVLLYLGYTLYIYMTWLKDSQATQIQIREVLEETKTEASVVFSDRSKENIEDVTQLYSFMDVDFTELLERNNEIVGYLNIPGIGLEYPITQTYNNDFYVDHGIDKQASQSGWVFVDCRNNLEFLEFNTIIYAHNRSDGTMFGALSDFLMDAVMSLEDADKIYFTTLNRRYIYEICSVYITKYTDVVYYKVDFSQEEKKYFIDKVNTSNIVDVFTRSNLSEKDSFLTLSTCYGAAGTDNRFVIHARLLAMD